MASNFIQTDLQIYEKGEWTENLGHPGGEERPSEGSVTPEGLTGQEKDELYL